MQSEPICLEEAEQAPGRRTRRPGTRALRAQPDAREPGALPLESHHHDFAALTNAELARRSAAEQAQYRQRLPIDERASLELFRRAIEERDASAWELIYQQWKPLLLHWLLAHPRADLALEHDSAEGYVTAALGKVWQATARAQRPPPGFARLSEMLAYVKRCLNSVVLDTIRQARAWHLEVPEAALESAVCQQPEVSGGELWRCVERALPDRRERLLLSLRYVQGYQPREVAAAYPDKFPTVAKVYQLERNILNRLRRHPALARWKE
jgi:hypothetical protein